MKPVSKTDLAIEMAADLIKTGTMLVIDPSSGSAGSMPGFAYFEGAEMVDFGILQLDSRKALNSKLFDLGTILRARFPKVDVFVMEFIAPFMGGKKGDFKGDAIVKLHKSIGAVQASVECTKYLEIAPKSWHAWLRKHSLHDNYDKTDENDAVVMGMFCLEKAGVVIDWDQYTQEEVSP